MPLPFQTAPEAATQVVGGPGIGELVFPVYGALLAGERLLIDAVDYDSVLFEQTARLANRLAEREELNDLDANLTAVRILSGRIGIVVHLSEQEQRIRLREAALIADVERQLRNASQRHTIRMVTAAIVYRLRQPDWSDADTEQEVPEPLRDAIYAFMLQEQATGRPQRNETEVLAELADTLGKLGPAATSDPPPTGEPSSGAAKTSGPMTPPSAPSALPTPPPPTSRRRSPRATG